MYQLHEAIKAKDKLKASLLLETAEYINTCDDLGFYPIHLSVLNGLQDITRRLLALGADPNVTVTKMPDRKKFLESFHDGSLDGDTLDCILHSIKQLGNYTPIHIAVRDRQYTQCQLLIQYGANVNSTDLGLCTPLHWAAMNGDIEIAKLLFSNGAKPNATDLAKSTPLHEAVRKNHYDFVVFLLMANADPSIRDISDLCPMDYAENKPNIVKLLTDRGQYVSCSSKQ